MPVMKTEWAISNQWTSRGLDSEKVSLNSTKAKFSKIISIEINLFFCLFVLSLFHLFVGFLFVCLVGCLIVDAFSQRVCECVVRLLPACAEGFTFITAFKFIQNQI